MCLLLGDVMIKMADFEVDICLLAERFVKDQGLNKAIDNKISKIFDKANFKGWKCIFYLQQGWFDAFANGFRE